MKTLKFLFLALFITGLFACNGAETTDADDNKINLTSPNGTDLNDLMKNPPKNLEDAQKMLEDMKEDMTPAQCDQMIKEYDIWMTKYIAMAKQAKANPTDVSYAQKAMKLSMEARNWPGKFLGCMEYEGYSDKIKAISDKASAAVRDL